MKLTEIATAILSMQSLLDKIVEKHEEIDCANISEELTVCLDATEGFQQHYVQKMFKISLWVKLPHSKIGTTARVMHFGENSFPFIEAGLRVYYSMD